MTALFVIAGALLGTMAGSIGGSSLLGLLFGVVVGILFARVEQLRHRLEQLASSQRAVPDTAPELPTPQDEQQAAVGAEPDWRAAISSSGRQQRIPEAIPDSVPEQASQQPPAAETWTSPEAWSSPALRLADPFERLRTAAWSWLTTGNVPVKVGVIVSLVGVSFLLKFAIERQLLSVPIELRLLAVALFAVALVVTGWRLRDRMRGYALTLQGGGMGMLYLTIFAAMRIWQLLPPLPAFVLLVLLTVAIAMLAVLQNAPTLAVFGVVGGFLAPVLASTGQGSHVVLFGYYLVINVGILVIAWFKAWRFLNLLGFAFTFVIAGLWGWRYFRPELFATTEPFLLLYFLFYQAIAVLYALRQPPERLGLVDGTLVFGTPVIAFALQYELVRNMPYGLAVSAAVLALFYAATATALFRRSGPYLRLLCESFIALAVAFATLAIPLALDARWTSASWALEGAALVWVGARQGRLLASLAGTALLFLAGVAFALHGWRDGVGLPVLNGNVLGGLLISLGSLFASRRLGGFAVADRHAGLLPHAIRILCVGLFAWGALWWLGTAWAEILDRIALSGHIAIFALSIAVSVLAASWLGEKRTWPEMRAAALAWLPLLALLVLLEIDGNGHFLHGFGWLAWPVAVAVQYQVLRSMDRLGTPAAGTWHAGTLVVSTLALAAESWWRVLQFASSAWALAAVLAIVGIAAMTIWRLRDAPAWPVAPHRATYLGSSLCALLLQVVWLTALCLLSPGDPAPLAYLPVANPFDLSLLFAGLVAWIGLRLVAAGEFPMLDPRSPAAAWMRRGIALAFVVMTSASLVRGIHFHTGVAWQPATLFDSVAVQTALSIWWGILGFTGMLVGTRRASRSMWLAGAGLMGLVVIKLFLVDLGNSGTVERIVSFIGVGGLLLVVGYFAPVPPRLAGVDEGEAA